MPVYTEFNAADTNPTVRNNKLLARLIGKVEMYGMNVQELYGTKQMPIKMFQPHKRWSTIMEIIEHIQQLERGRWSFTIDPWSFELIDYSDTPEKTVFTLQFEADDSKLLSRYYAAAVAFAEYYFKQNPSATT